MFKMHLNGTGWNRITPNADPIAYDASKGTICQAFHWSANSVYECKNKGQLIKYYHAVLYSHPETTLVAAAKARYLEGLNLHGNGTHAPAFKRHLFDDIYIKAQPTSPSIVPLRT